jgi:hypothetical protein
VPFISFSYLAQPAPSALTSVLIYEHNRPFCLVGIALRGVGAFVAPPDLRSAQSIKREPRVDLELDETEGQNKMAATLFVVTLGAAAPTTVKHIQMSNAGSPEYRPWRESFAGRYHSTEDNLSRPVDTSASAVVSSFSDRLETE